MTAPAAHRTNAAAALFTGAPAPVLPRARPAKAPPTMASLCAAHLALSAIERAADRALGAHSPTVLRERARAMAVLPVAVVLEGVLLAAILMRAPMLALAPLAVVALLAVVIGLGRAGRWVRARRAALRADDLVRKAACRTLAVRLRGYDATDAHAWDALSLEIARHPNETGEILAQWIADEREAIELQVRQVRLRERRAAHTSGPAAGLAGTPA